MCRPEQTVCRRLPTPARSRTPAAPPPVCGGAGAGVTGSPVWRAVANVDRKLLRISRTPRIFGSAMSGSFPGFRAMYEHAPHGSRNALTDVYTSPQRSNNGVSVRHAARRAMFEHPAVPAYTDVRTFRRAVSPPSTRTVGTGAQSPPRSEAAASVEGREELTHSRIGRGMYDV